MARAIRRAINKVIALGLAGRPSLQAIFNAEIRIIIAVKIIINKNIIRIPAGDPGSGRKVIIKGNITHIDRAAIATGAAGIVQIAKIGP